MVLQHPRWAKKGLQEGSKRVIHCKSAEGKVFGMKPTSLASSSSEEEKVGEGEEEASPSKGSVGGAGGSRTRGARSSS